jgi:tRNA threonylcarbamoyladenosine biosynthesis protein TsaB
MNTILYIETSTDICSVSLSANEKEMLTKETRDANSHAARLTNYIKAVMDECGTSPGKLDAVAVSQGPGSYTGLRIGVSAAKGICYAKGIPLIAVDTLKALANGALQSDELKKQHGNTNTLLCPMIDARRMDVYDAFFDLNLDMIRETAFTRIGPGKYDDILNSHKVYFFGNGTGKCKDTIKKGNAVFIDDIYCSARNMILPGYAAFKNKTFVDTAYFEPFYLKNFVATKSKKKLF